MKKVSMLVLSLSFLGLVVATSNAQALVFEGNPDENADHFAWSLMSQLQTPDDPDCMAVAQAAIAADGTLPGYVDPVLTSQYACQGLASMKTSMQADMESGQGEDSVATNLFSATNWHAVENLYFQHSANGVPDGKIEFSKPIDFMNYSFMKFMSSFGENMDASQSYISLDADVVGGFANYGATLTMYNVPNLDNPVILVDGKEDTKGIVSNIVYNKDNNTLTFSAKHFTSFEAAEASSVGSPKITRVKYEKYLSTTGKEKVRVSVYGKRFKSNAKVKFGSKSAYRVKKSSSKKLTAYFSMNDLKQLGHEELRIKVENSNGNTDSYKSKKKLDNIKFQENLLVKQ